MTSTTDLLAYFPSPPRGVWDLGPFPLRAYALFIIVGIVVAIWWGDKRWVARGGAPGTVLDVAIWAVPFGLIGGRLYHVATDWSTYFGEGGHPADALKIWQGGLGIWGAVLLGGIGAWIGCRLRGISVAALGDAIAPAILLAQAIGRIGNYFNQELYGRETTVPWGMKVYERIDSNGAVDALNGVSTGVVEKVVHPTFLYELLWNLIVVGVLVLVDRRYAIGHGRLFALYVAGYCLGRFGVELMRDDYATHIGGVRINTFTSAIVFVLAVAYLIFARKGRETPEELAPEGHGDPDGAVEADEKDDAVTTAEADADAPSDAKKADEAEKPDSVEKAEPAKTEPAKADAVKTEPVETEAAKADAAKSKPVQDESAKSEPVKTQAAETEPKATTLEKADDSDGKAAAAEPKVEKTADAEPAEAAEKPKSDAKTDTPAAEEPATDKTEPEKVETVEPETPEADDATEPPATEEPTSGSSSIGGQVREGGRRLRDIVKRGARR